MSDTIRKITAESRIINTCVNLNKTLLLYFYNSKTHKFFINFNNFLQNNIFKDADKSMIMKAVKSAYKRVALKDIGVFVILTVLFNTLAMIILKKEIDIFSILARTTFFIIGAALYVRDMRFCKK